MARALFKSWFVDFDPVYGKTVGRDIDLPAHIAQFFPERMVDSELGEIPEGWKVGVMGDVAQLLSGGTPETSVPQYWDGNIPWYPAKDAPSLDAVFVLETERNITQAGIENSSAKVLPARTTVITARGTVGRLACFGTPMAINQTCYGIRGAGRYPDLFTYYNVKMAVGELQRRAHGLIFDTITRRTFGVVDIAIPPLVVANTFDAMVNPLMDQILVNMKESRALVAVRDALLAKLISGEIRAGNGERRTEVIA